MTRRQTWTDYVAQHLAHGWTIFAGASTRRQLRRVRMWGETPGHQPLEGACGQAGNACGRVTTEAPSDPS
ncbi:MAG: hypothetical protein AAF993_04200 [Pseudomonadota bacterium]